MSVYAECPLMDEIQIIHFDRLLNFICNDNNLLKDFKEKIFFSLYVISFLIFLLKETKY